MPATDALRAAYESVLPRAPGLTFDAFLKATQGWEVIPVQVDRAIVGAILISGSEVHACVKPEASGRWFGKPVLRLLNRIITEHGHATTRVHSGCEAGIQFVRRLGFTQADSDSGVMTFRKVSHGL